MQTLPKLLNAAISSAVASLVHSSTCAVVTLSRKHYIPSRLRRGDTILQDLGLFRFALRADYDGGS
jgi:hypothetical protein